MLVATSAAIIPSTKIENAYLNAFLLSNFGIVVDKPALLSKEMVKDISDVYKLNVPKSYFANPQDTKFYTADELLIEQCISYFLAYGAEESHVHVFDKKLPEYSEILQPEMKVVITGKVQHRGEGQTSLMLDSAKSVDNSNIMTLCLLEEIKYEELTGELMMLCLLGQIKQDSSSWFSRNKL
jgi:hypothetical protein